MMTSQLHDVNIATSRDVVELLRLDDSLLQADTFYDVTETLDDDWTTTMTSRAADDSGVFLSQYINYDNECCLGTPSGNPGYDVIGEHVSGTTFAPAPNDNIDIMSQSGDASATDDAGNSRDDVSSFRFRFSDEQIVCICIALQQRRDIDRLESFLSCHVTFGSHGGDYDVFPVTSRSSDVVDAILSSVAHVAYERGRYRQLYDVLEGHSFPPVYHAGLQQLWYDAHYAEASTARRRPLSAVDKYRVRRRHPLPRTIWDGQDTVYSFKVRQTDSSPLLTL